MKNENKVMLISVAGGQPDFDETLYRALQDEGLTCARFDLDSELERVLDTLASGAMPVVLKPAPR
ncbi:hypothetical protein [Thiohalophilus sp.]|uniref:hypothetical protein n=1 Tax=Thiohalophilus sp. TaxID=3028392 RepID=UPI002ACE0442|nr:hypothetical protein [Thiohalophilus sp.]MDZ7662402.1 hypothetical protein [Thiohalophilus sp.]